MAFVYRYSSIRGTPRYVGMVKGDTMEQLLRRLKQHEAEDKFKGHVWVIEYIDGLSVTDAELLESHYIGIYQKDLFNIAKRNHGPITLEISNLPEWKPLSEAQRGIEKTPKNHSLWDAPHCDVMSFTCSRCGKVCEYYPSVISIRTTGLATSFFGWAAFWLCHDCVEVFATLRKHIESEYMKHEIRLVRYAGPYPRRVRPKISCRRDKDNA